MTPATRRCPTPNLVLGGPTEIRLKIGSIAPRHFKVTQDRSVAYNYDLLVIHGPISPTRCNVSNLFRVLPFNFCNGIWAQC